MATPTTARRRAYSYTRFSSPEQAAGDSLRRQLDAARAYADKHDLDLDTELHDAGVSAYAGKNVTEGALGSFMNRVDAGDIPAGSVLLVEALDRLSRMAPLDALDLLRAI